MGEKKGQGRKEARSAKYLSKDVEMSAEMCVDVSQTSRAFELKNNVKLIKLDKLIKIVNSLIYYSLVVLTMQICVLSQNYIGIKLLEYEFETKAHKVLILILDEMRVRQGYVLSPLLFNVYWEVIFEKVLLAQQIV